MIGYYVHHVGQGHRTRAALVAGQPTAISYSGYSRVGGMSLTGVSQLKSATRPPINNPIATTEPPNASHIVRGTAGVAGVGGTTVSVSVMMLFHGAISDAFGRRPVILTGVGLYAIASIGCALAPSMAWLSVFRAVSAFGASAGMVISRAVVRDLADGHLGSA